MKILLASLAVAVLVPPQTTRADSEFNVKLSGGAITSLRRVHDRDPVNTDYVSGRRLGDIAIKYREPGGDWKSIQTADLAGTSAATVSTNADGASTSVVYQITNGSSALRIESAIAVHDRDIVWNVELQNSGSQPLEVGDLSVPVTIGARGRGAGGGGGGGQRQPVILKHSFIEGHGSYLFWMRNDLVGPYLMMVPDDMTSLEYWEAAGRGGYQVFVHSAVAGEIAKEGGTKWRQPNTSIILGPGDTTHSGFKFQWADDYDAVRQNLVDDGKIDVHVVPGMTLPNDLPAEFSLRTKQKITAVEAEFPSQTTIKLLETKGDTHIYEVKFARLGENRLNVKYGAGEHMYLEFFSTEPLETLIKKRADFLANHQQWRGITNWFNGLYADWNMSDGILNSPINHDAIVGRTVYEIASDDAGESRPAYMAGKESVYPVQSEIESLDLYITNFVWGGMQRTTEETYSYGVYGINDWHQNRLREINPGRGRGAGSTNVARNVNTNRVVRNAPNVTRVYDYPHFIDMYWGMYKVAKFHPEVHTALPAQEYLRRAWGTAVAMFTVPTSIDRGWNAYGTGFYSELVIPDVIDALEQNGMKKEADELRGHWERKVRYFVNEKADLFQSEYAFDSTGFESTEALARYAVLHADTPSTGVTPADSRKFMADQIDANIFCRGWLEPAYYLYGSDYRSGGGNGYTLSYMAQMGGWGVLDYGLNFATNSTDYIRLGYASYLSEWATMNTGTPESGYGYFYPGKANDGAASGGYEPAPFGRSWLGLEHHRGPWPYSCEGDLGFCGALRAAATVLADDPIFGRFCYGGDFKKSFSTLDVIPRDGVRRRFNAMLSNGDLHLILDTDQFAAGKPIALKNDLSQISFLVESDNPAAHTIPAHLSASASGHYTIRAGGKTVATVDLAGGKESVVQLPMGTKPESFTIARD